MNEREVKLPVCGGRVWLRTRISDGRMDDIENAFLRHLPRDAIASLTKTALQPGANPEEVTDVLTRSGFDVLALKDATKASERDRVRLVVKRWSGVVGPESDHEVEFPDGIAELDPFDFTFLLEACQAAIREASADPNATGETSSSSSPPTSEAPVSPARSTTP